MQNSKRHDCEILSDFVSNLYADNSLKNRFNLYDNLVRSLGFDAVCYSFIPRPELKEELKSPPIFEYSKQFPTDFMDRYEKDDFYNKDFTIREIKAGNLIPKDWKTYELTGDLSDEEINVIRVAREEYGINNALSIPTMNNQLGIAGASLISSKSDKGYQQVICNHQQTLVNCTRIFNDVIMQHASSDVAKTFVLTTLPNLTTKQEKVLRTLLNGTLQKNIGLELGMSQSAVENHLLNLRNLFHVNKTHDLKSLLETLNILDYL